MNGRLFYAIMQPPPFKEISNRNTAMRKSVSSSQRPEEILLSAAILVLIVTFTYAYFFAAPYSGFYFNPSNGEVIDIYVPGDPASAIQKRYIIQSIGGGSLPEHKSD